MRKKLKTKRINISITESDYKKLSDVAFSNFLPPATMARTMLKRGIINESERLNRKGVIQGTRQLNIFKKERK